MVTVMSTSGARHDVAAGARPVRDEDARVWDVAARVHDPELPVLSISDLGILRHAEQTPDGGAFVVITPTYSGCPAMDTISADVTGALRDAGYEPVSVRLALSPAWTTDWMTDAGKAKLQEFGIAPPTGTRPARARGAVVPVALSVRCPRCGSLTTRELSRFGSTACKALYVCGACQEPFDHFKAH